METMLERLGAVAPSAPAVAAGALGLFLLVLLVAPLSRRGAARRTQRIALAAVRDLPRAGGARAWAAGAAKLGLLVAIVAVTAFLWGELMGRASGGGAVAGRQERLKTVLAVFDISSSMGTPFGGQQRGSRFVVARDALASFLADQEDSRAGVIFYSTDVFEYRRPTRDIDQLVADFSRLEIVRAGGQQLAELSWGTDTAQALERAAVVMESLDLTNVRSGVVILVSDLLDDKMKVARAVNGLTERNIRVYILSIEGGGAAPSAAVADALALNPRVRAFHIRSPEDMREVYPAIASIESALADVQEPPTQREVRSRLAVWTLFGLLVCFVVTSELMLPRVRTGF